MRQVERKKEVKKKEGPTIEAIIVIRRECGQTLGRVRVRTDIGQ